MSATTTWELVHKPTFTNQLLALPRNEVPKILEKVTQLCDNPHADANNRTRVASYKGQIYRLRCGDYRVLYTYGTGWVALLGVDDRKDVYRHGQLVEAEGIDFDPGEVPDAEDALKIDRPRTPEPRPQRPTEPRPSADDGFLRPIDDALLRQLRVPAEYHAALRGCTDFDALSSATVPGEWINRVFDAVTTPNYELVVDQPSFVTGDTDDLLRFVEGEIFDFLLKLDPEQEKFVSWAVRGAGPTLVKGGPGTGKSTVALYRVRALLEALRRDGIAQPRILFTTYTNALVKSSEQLLRRLLGEDAALVTVRTADSLVREIIAGVEKEPFIADAAVEREAFDEALRTAQYDGSALQRRAQQQAIEKISRDYLLAELNGVIEARALATREDYLAAPRAGRRVALNATQRTAIWRVHEAYERALAKRGRTTWQRARRRAAEIVAAGHGPAPFDGVVVDEAQDLDATVLRLLVGLCRTPDRLFVTADANQSIYGSAFRWTDVHADLKFQGRTGILRQNHRSTREIGTAADGYLRDAALDTGDDGSTPLETLYSQTGPLPIVRAVTSAYDEQQLLARFLRESMHWLRIGPGGCAVLVPTVAAGNAIAGRLRDAGIDAAYMEGRALDLERKAVKVLTLQSAKGLEFPIVAVAGFLEGWVPGAPRGASADEADEALRQARRTMFVAMTRAMRALLVVTPAGHHARLFEGFDPARWNLGADAAESEAPA